MSSDKFYIVGVTGPSGAGKSSIVKEILESFPEFKDLVTYTTRPKREGELDGQDYFFITEGDFKAKIQKGFFLEWVHNHDFYYGSSKDLIQKYWDEKKHIILDINYEGALKLKEHFPDNSYVIFLLPPDQDTMRHRIQSRSLMGEKELDSRINEFKKEIHYKEVFDFNIVNENFSHCFERIKKNLEKLVRKE